MCSNMQLDGTFGFFDLFFTKRAPYSVKIAFFFTPCNDVIEVCCGYCSIKVVEKNMFLKLLPLVE